jgi:hypothetical protein
VPWGFFTNCHRLAYNANPEVAGVEYICEYDAENDVLRITWAGIVQDEVFEARVAEGRKFLASHAGSRGIIDFSGVTKFASTEVIRAIALKEPRGEEKSVVVIVAPQDSIFGSARMFSILTESTRPYRHVVRTIEKAYELLEIKNPRFDRVELS